MRTTTSWQSPLQNVSIVFGLWFHNDSERASIFQALKRGEVVSPPSSAVKSNLLLSALKTPPPPPPLIPVLSGGVLTDGVGFVTPPSSSAAQKASSASKTTTGGDSHKAKGNVNNVNSSNQPSVSSSTSSAAHSVPVSTPPSVVPPLSSANAGSTRLLGLLKASGRDVPVATGGIPSSDIFASLSPAPTSPPLTVPVTSGGQALSAMLKSAIRVSPPSTPTPSVSSTTSSITSSSTAPKIAEEERNAKLLSMLRVATTSEQAMDLLTDGDIASKTKKEGNRLASPDRSSVSGITHSDTAPTSGGAFRDLSSPVTTTNSSDRLFAVLKSPTLRSVSSATSLSSSVDSSAAVCGDSGVTSLGGSVNSSRSATPSSSVKMLSVSDLLNQGKPASTSDGVASAPQRSGAGESVLSRSSSMKENQLRGLSANSVAPHTSTALIVIKKPLSPPTKPLSPPTRVLAAPLSSAEKAKLLAVARSPELRGMTHSSAKVATASTGSGRQPMLLSPSDLLRGGAPAVVV
eukprot:gene30764-38025_t